MDRQWKQGGDHVQGSPNSHGGLVGQGTHEMHPGIQVSDSEQIYMPPSQPVVHGSNQVKGEQVARVGPSYSMVGACQQGRHHSVVRAWRRGLCTSHTLQSQQTDG